MKKFLTKKLSLRVFVGASALAVLIAAGSVAYATHSWGPYHWARTANPFTLKTVDSVTSAWDSYLDTAITDWSQSSVLDLIKETGATGTKDRRLCRSISGKIRACNYTYGNNGWLGVAQIWIDSNNHIAKGTTKLNDTYFNTAAYNTPPWRRLVMCQEIAHDFGLAHQDENFYNPNLGSCMDYTADPDGPPSNEHPNQHDYDMLQTIYAHLDSYTTLLDSAPKGHGKSGLAPGADVSDPSEWGTVLRRDGNGRPSLYGRDLGNGEKVFTFVFWADEK